MNKTKRGLRVMGFAALVAGAAMLPPGAAQDAGLTVEVGECVDLATPEERLACFEAQVEAARNAPPAESPAPTAAAPAAASTAAPELGQKREREPEVQPPDIFAKVVELKETVPNAYVITLDNGQVWRQTLPKYYPLQPGADVRIYSAWGGATRLTNPVLRSHIQVERVR